MFDDPLLSSSPPKLHVEHENDLNLLNNSIYSSEDIQEINPLGDTTFDTVDSYKHQDLKENSEAELDKSNHINSIFNKSSVNNSAHSSNNTGNMSKPSTYESHYDKSKDLAPCCAIDKALKDISVESYIPKLLSSANFSPSKPIIVITDALKLNEGSSSTFVSYVIKTEVSNPPGTFWESKHRYSEFEALRTLLTRIYKTSCVAPIPEKQTLGDYTKPKAKEDNHMIQKRKRMLQLFLNRIASHPILGRDHVFHQFLEGVLGWNEILSSTGFAYLLKKGSDGGGAGGGTISKLTERTILKNHDPQFLAAEDFTFRFNHQVSITHRSEKKIQKIHKEIADTYADLGKRFNIWSLTDSKLSPVIERIGSSFDALAGQNSLLALNLEIKVTEPLQEYTQFAKVVEKLLKVRHKKHAEWETVTESLATKQSNLDKWESSEKEAERISAVLNAEGSSRNDTEQHHIQKPSQGLLATLNSFIDNDPELTRRNNISKAKDAILLLKEKEALVLQELKKYNQEIQFDLDRFQRAKIKDFRNLFLNFCLAQKEFHLKCKNEFKGCKEEIERLKFD